MCADDYGDDVEHANEDDDNDDDGMSFDHIGMFSIFYLKP